MTVTYTKFDEHRIILKESRLNTPLGTMLAISDERGLYLLEFIDRRGLEQEGARLCITMKATIVLGAAAPIHSARSELKSYFAGTSKEFKTSTHLLGSAFQKNAWQELMNTPYGETRSYLSQAQSIGNHKATRAVANANGANKLAILIPCHRIINSNGKLGGYGGGIMRKKWLINHEQQYK